MGEPIRRMYWSARYESASNHLHTRIAARENILIGYIAAAMTLIGVAFGSSEFRKLALVIPYMAASVALILSNHENVIRQLEEHLANLTEGIPDDWYSRVNMSEERIRGLGYRTAALFVVIGGSSIVSVLIGRSVATDHVLVWYGSVVASICALIWIVQPRIRRMRQYIAWRHTQQRRNADV